MPLTCDELNSEIEMLSGQIQMNDSQIATYQASIAATYGNLGTVDVFPIDGVPGTHGPIPLPLTEAAVQHRLTDLAQYCTGSTMFAAMYVCSLYQSILYAFQHIDSLNAENADLATQLQAAVDAKKAQNCP